MVRPREVVALVSGGPDSLALVDALVRQGRRVRPVYVRCGLRWEPVELASLRRWLSALRSRRVEALGVLSVPVGDLYGRHWSVTGRGVPSASSRDAAVYLPGRNLLLMSHAAVFAAGRGVSTVAIGTLAGNPFGDATPAFFRSLGRALSLALGRRVTIEAPLRRASKASLIAARPELPWALTFSCIRPAGRRHCGRCNKCAERRRAFRAARVTDPTHYAC